jgi:uncharacterized protein YecE (DUF72 family)
MFRYDRARIEPFLEMLPHDTEAACAFARKRSAWMQGRACLVIDQKRELRHAIEIRHESFCDPSFIELLRHYNIALAIADTAGRWPMIQDITANFVYIRLHGDKELYRSGYGDEALQGWARRISAWSNGSEPEDADKVLNRKPRAGQRDVYCFFDNTDVKLRAPVDARTLMGMLGLTPGPGLDLQSLRGAVRTPSTARRRAAEVVPDKWAVSTASPRNVRHGRESNTR